MCTPAVEDGCEDIDSFADNVGELGLFAIFRVLEQRFFLLCQIKRVPFGGSPAGKSSEAKCYLCQVAVRRSW